MRIALDEAVIGVLGIEADLSDIRRRLAARTVHKRAKSGRLVLDIIENMRNPPVHIDKFRSGTIASHIKCQTRLIRSCTDWNRKQKPKKYSKAERQKAGAERQKAGEAARGDPAQLPEFEAIMMYKSDPVDLFMEWYNHRRPHMSLGVDGQEETPVQRLHARCHPKEKSWLTSRPERSTVLNEREGTTFHTPTVKGLEFKTLLGMT